VRIVLHMFWGSSQLCVCVHQAEADRDYCIVCTYSCFLCMSRLTSRLIKYFSVLQPSLFAEAWRQLGLSSGLSVPWLHWEAPSSTMMRQCKSATTCCPTWMKVLRELSGHTTMILPGLTWKNTCILFGPGTPPQMSRSHMKEGECQYRCTGAAGTQVQQQ